MENLRYKDKRTLFDLLKTNAKDGTISFRCFFFFSSRALPDRLISFNTKNEETSYFEGKLTTVTKHSDVIVLYD